MVLATSRLSLERVGRVKKANPHERPYVSISFDPNRVLLRSNDTRKNLVKEW